MSTLDYHIHTIVSTGRRLYTGGNHPHGKEKWREDPGDY